MASQAAGGTGEAVLCDGESTLFGHGELTLLDGQSTLRV